MQTRRIMSLLLLVVEVLFGSGCGSIKESDIVGSYEARPPCVTVQLVLSRDHSFVQTVRTSAGEANEVRGRWELLDKSSEARSVWGRLTAHFSRTVHFEPFLDFLHDSRGEQVQGATLQAETQAGGIHMGPVLATCSGSLSETEYTK